MDFEHVLVVGAGQMGGGIAQVVAASGRCVSLYDSYPGATDRGLATMRKSLEKLAEKGGADPDEVLARVTAVDEIAPADLMVEAVIEDFEIKQDVFRRAEDVLDPDHVARRRDPAARPRDRHALLQPGAGPQARRGRAWKRDVRRNRR